MSGTWSDLEQFFLSRVGQTKLGRDTDLYHDLDMQPKRIAEVMSAWAAKFGVDIAGFDLSYYYPSEKLGIAGFLLTVSKSPFSKSAREVLGGRALTLGMLEEAMQKGRWEA